MDHEKPSQSRFDKTVMSVHKEKDMSTRHANGETGVADIEGDHKIERNILRRLDAVVLPLTTLLYLSVRFCCWRL